MGCVFSKSMPDRDHGRIIHPKLQEALESCTADPHDIIKMNSQPEAVPAINTAEHHVTQLPAAGSTRFSEKFRTAAEPQRDGTSSSKTIEEIWASLQASGEPRRPLCQANQRFQLPPKLLPSEAKGLTRDTINSPAKGNAGPARAWTRKTVSPACSSPPSQRKISSRRYPFNSSPPSKISGPSSMNSAEIAQVTSFRRHSVHAKPSSRPMDIDEAFGITLSGPGTSGLTPASNGSAEGVWREPHDMHGQPLGSASENGMPRPSRSMVPGSGDEIRMGSRWRRKAQADSPIRDSIPHFQHMSIGDSDTRGGSEVGSAEGTSLILDTQHTGGSSAGSTPRLMMDRALPGSGGVKLHSSPVRAVVMERPPPETGSAVVYSNFTGM